MRAIFSLLKACLNLVSWDFPFENVRFHLRLRSREAMCNIKCMCILLYLTQLSAWAYYSKQYVLESNLSKWRLYFAFIYQFHSDKSRIHVIHWHDFFINASLYKISTSAKLNQPLHSWFVKMTVTPSNFFGRQRLQTLHYILWLLEILYFARHTGAS